MSLGANGVDRVRSKNSNATSWHELFHQFDPFCTEYWKAIKQSQMHPNSTKSIKKEFRVQWGGSGAFIAKNSNATLWHELLHQFDPFCTKCCMATKESQMHPISTKRVKLVQKFVPRSLVGILATNTPDPPL